MGGTAGNDTILCTASPFFGKNFGVGSKFKVYSMETSSSILPTRNVILYSEELATNNGVGILTKTPGVDYVNQYQRYQFYWQGNYMTSATMPMHFKVNPNTSDLTGEENCVANGFDTWEADTYSTVDFTYDGTTTINYVDVSDGTNACFWQTAQWFSNMGYPNAVAATWLHFYGGGNYGSLQSWDMAFNDGENWYNGAYNNCYDVQSIATHEAGHVCGLLDLTINSGADIYATMYKTADLNSIAGRSLETGDLDGLRWIYSSGTYIPPGVDITSPTGGYISGPTTVYATISVPYGTLSNVKFKATTFSSSNYDSGWISMTLSGGQYVYTWTPPAGSGVTYYLSVRAELTNGMHGFDWVVVTRS